MNKDWKEALKKLRKLAGNNACLLKAEQWYHAPGLVKGRYTRLVYIAYIEGIHHSEGRSTPMRAVEELEAKIK